MELTLIDFQRLWQLSTNFWPFFGPFDEVASQVLDLGDVPTQLHDGPRFLCVLFVKFVHSLGTYVLFTNDATLKVTRCCCLQKSRKTLNLAKETFFFQVLLPTFYLQAKIALFCFYLIVAIEMVNIMMQSIHTILMDWQSCQEGWSTRRTTTHTGKSIVENHTLWG